MVLLPAGYDLRPAVPADLPEVAGLMAAVDVSEFGAAETGPDEVAEQWDRPRFVVERDAVVITSAAGGLAAYCDIWDPEPGDFDIDSYVHPGQPRALEAALVDWAEARVRARAGPAGGAVMHTVRAGVDDEGAAVLAGSGWEYARTYLRMAIDLDRNRLPQPIGWPAGMSVAPFQPGIDDAVAHALVEDAFADHFRHPSVSLPEFQQVTLGGRFDAALSFIARHDHQPVACLLGYDEGERGWVKELGVVRSWRGRGLGQALLVHAFRTFAERGLTRVELGVDADNATGATRLYERVGMQEVRQYHFYVRELTA